MGDSQEGARARRLGEVSLYPGQERPMLIGIGVIQPEVSHFVCLTLAITWPKSVLVEEDRLAVKAQVHGGVS